MWDLTLFIFSNLLAVAVCNLRDSRGMVNESFWRNNDFSKGSLPENLRDLLAQVEVQSKTVVVWNTEVFYRLGNPVKGVDSSGQNVVLLHGQRFSSQNWQDLGTIQFLTASGHSVAAIDLPGFGKSKQFAGDKAEFLKTFISSIGFKDAIIVSPSYSGIYSVPYIESHWKEANGFVPVAATHSESFKNTGSHIKVPTLNIVGELDSFGFGKQTIEHIRNIPTSQTVIIPKASHPAYLDNPDLFHSLLYNFIGAIKKNAT